jgi:histidyl-tRNA synthetase
LPLAAELRSKGIGVEMEYEARGLKGQMKQAGKSGAGSTLIIGPGELESGSAVLQKMATGEKIPVNIKVELKILAEGLAKILNLT